MSEETIVTQEPAPAAAPIPAPAPTGKVFTEEYVQTLREEAKSHRLAKKQYATQLKSLLGLKDEEEVTDAAIEAYKQAAEKRITDAQIKANEKLILAAIRGLAGYDTKLLERLVEKSKLTITENGDVEGLTEIVTALEAEFPQIKKTSTPAPAAPPNPAGGAPHTKTPLDEYNELLALAQKSPNDSFIRQRLFVAKEKLINSKKT
jgi:hypothetical protein